MANPRGGRRNLQPHGRIGRAGFSGRISSEGNRGGRRRGGTQPCRFFQGTGHCRFGDLCNYSHDLSLGSSTGLSWGQPRERAQGTPDQQQAKSEYNSWKRLIKKPPIANDTATIQLLWNNALKILDGEDGDCKQMLPRDLDDEENYGRQHILTLLNMVAHTQGYSKFVDLARPFLLVITHSALLHCLSVDTFVGGLYNFISGTNGSRGIQFFQRLCTNLLKLQLEPATMQTPAENLETTLIAMSTALRELLRREQRAVFHEDLPPLVNSMESILDAIDIVRRSPASQTVRNVIEEVRGMIARTNGLLQREEEPHVGEVITSVVTSTYPRDLILPRDRHDNDKLDITKIRILPTEDEIRSNHVDFLPSTDPDQPHFLTNKVERHLDTFFRLLRHDVFGELMESLNTVLTALHTGSATLEDPRFSLGAIRAYSYPRAHITYVSFDQRRGLEAHISFSQPSFLRKKSPSERRTWWQESKRLDEGVLLCLLFVEGVQSSLLFFTIREKFTETKRDDGLSMDNHQGIIKAKLATRTQNDLELMIRMSCQKSRGVLIEFPDVLLATFVPILENIQKMQRQSRLPFNQWIIPDRPISNADLSKTVDVPPPLYALRPGFTFSLKPILKDPDGNTSMTLKIPVDSSIAADELEARTNLDRGQCKALIAALTCEFAFIQGPPGTGKSYLGVQLMRVLLASKDEAKLGPIVVM